jgi:hypothetical protein
MRRTILFGSAALGLLGLALAGLYAAFIELGYPQQPSVPPLGSRPKDRPGSTGAW